MIRLGRRLTAPVFVWALALPAMAQVIDPITPETDFTRNDLVDTLNSLANWLLGIIAVIAVILILWGGFLYITAAGNQEKLDKGKGVVIYGLIGVLVAILAFAIVSFVASFLA